MEKTTKSQLSYTLQKKSARANNFSGTMGGPTGKNDHEISKIDEEVRENKFIGL